MAQYGASTVIAPGTRLILADCFETLIALGPGGYRPRRGVPAFIDHFTVRLAIPLSVVSDAAEEPVRAALEQAGLLGGIRRLWHAGNASEAQEGGRRVKRLDLVLAGEGVAADQAVFIGDSQLDSEAAQRFGVPFIRVPRSEDAAFDFASLIAGPSRYSSGQFSAAFLDSFRRRPER